MIKPATDEQFFLTGLVWKFNEENDNFSRTDGRLEVTYQEKLVKEKNCSSVPGFDVGSGKSSGKKRPARQHLIRALVCCARASLSLTHQQTTHIGKDYPLSLLLGVL